MRIAARIFFRDIRRILRNPIAVVVAIGVCIIPSLYAWLNILANWDPYENTSTVPIAVTIEDEGADVTGMGHVNAGKMVRERLAENTQLGWAFVDSQSDALEGVRAGTYYAAFVIPADFTDSLADVLQGDTGQAHIAYYVNEKANAIAPKVADTGATTLENQIANQFVAVVGQTVTEELREGAKGAAGSLDEARASAEADLRGAGNEVETLADSLGDTQSAIENARETVTEARGTLAELDGASASLTSSLDRALGQLSATRSGARSLASQLNSALSTGSTAISGVSSTASYDIGQLTGDIGWAQGRIDAALSQVRSLNGTVQTLKTSLENTRTTILSLKLGSTSAQFRTEATSQLDTEISYLVELSDTQLARLDELEALSADVKAGNDAVLGLSDSVNQAVQTSSQGLSDLQANLSQTTVPELSDALDSFSDAGGRLAGTSSAIPPMLTQADGTLEQLDAVLAQSSDAVGHTQSSLLTAAAHLKSLADDVAAVQSAQNLAGLGDLLSIDPQAVGSFIGSPVEMVSESVYPVANYGSGVAPFYTNLALWVGGFVLVAIYKLEVDDEGVGRFKPWQGFLGRWLLLGLFGQVQALVCCVGDILLGIQCLHPVAFVFAGMVESLVYVFFIYSISVAFKHVGKALGVLLVILQIPGASGTYPIEMMPGFFQALHPWLPFTYGINAMREAIAGYYDAYYAQSLLVLLVYLIPALLVGVAARRHLLNVNALFDRRLAETDLMISERTSLEGAHFRLSTIVKVIMNSKEYRATFLERAAKFELMYPTLVRRGFAALVWVPLALLSLLFVTPAKFAALVCWILSLIVICTFLIVVEYLHDRVGEKVGLAGMSREELYTLLDDELRDELMAFAPLDKMRLDSAIGPDGPDSGAEGPEELPHTPGGSERGGDD